VDWCVEHEIGTIIFGYNEDWKQKIKIGRRNNQTFTQVPFMEIINKTSYKAKEKGIEVKKQEESHTSSCSFLE
jgi:putative transposase